MFGTAAGSGSNVSSDAVTISASQPTSTNADARPHDVHATLGRSSQHHVRVGPDPAREAPAPPARREHRHAPLDLEIAAVELDAHGLEERRGLRADDARRDRLRLDVTAQLE